MWDPVDSYGLTKRLSPPPSEVHSPFCRAPWFHSSRLPLPRLGTGTPLPQRLMGVSYPRLARLSRGKIKLFWENCRKPFSEQAGPFKNPFWEEHRLTELQMHPFHWLGQHPCACGRFGIEKNGRYRRAADRRFSPRTRQRVRWVRQPCAQKLKLSKTPVGECTPERYADSRKEA